jgi:hypothetical protein
VRDNFYGSRVFLGVPMCNKMRQLIFEVRMKAGICKELEILGWRVNTNPLRSKGEGKLALVEVGRGARKIISVR